MANAAWWAAYRRRRSELTPLQEATNALYRACRANGGHTLSDERVMRDDGGFLLSLRICAKCGVPINKLHGWGTQTSSARGGRH